MKTTLELPDDLVKQVKLRAIKEGRKLKDEVAELLRSGLGASRRRGGGAKRSAVPRIRTDPLTGLPVIQCRRSAPPGKELTPDRIAEILLAQDV